jgi:Secretion system C-terminal sorting domain
MTTFCFAMKKFIAIIIVLLFQPNFSFSQNFSKIFNDGFSTNIIRTMTSQNDSIFVVTGFGDDLMSLTIFDKHGNLCKLDTSAQIFDNIGMAEEHLVNFSQNTYFSSGYGTKLLFFPDTSNRTTLRKRDQNFQLIWQKQYFCKYCAYSSGLIRYKNNDLILMAWGNSNPDSSGYSQMCLLRLDSSGNVKWIREFLGHAPITYDGDIKVNFKDEIFVSAHQRDRDTTPQIGTTINKSLAMLWKVDSMGNTMDSTYFWATEDYHHPNGYENCVNMPLADGGVMLVYQRDTIALPPNARAKHVVRLDSNLNVKWDYFFWKSYFDRVWGLRICKNGDIIGWGDRNVCSPPGPNIQCSGIWPWIFRFSPDGVLKWERFIRDTCFEGFILQNNKGGNYVPEVFEMSDGSLIAGTTLNFYNEPANPFRMWLFKLDSMGCYVPGCKDSTVIVPCTMIAADEPAQSILQSKKFKITPNPAHDFLEMQFFEPVLSQNTTVQVLSEKGEVVFESALSVGISSKKIKCDDWPPGVYFLAFSENGRVFQTEKVVVFH